MKAKDLKMNSLVWAKMKGFSPWPAKIGFPADGKRPHPKKPKHFVTFFGTRNHAWILDEFIHPHSRKMLQNAKSYKKISKTFEMAIKEINMESRKLAKKRKKLLKVQVKIENCDEMPQKLGIATEKSVRLTSKNKGQIQKKYRKQPTTDSKNNSLQVKTKYRSLFKVKVKIEPKDPYNENSLSLGNATEKSKRPVSTNKTRIVREKVQNGQVPDIMSNDFKSTLNQVEKKHKMILRQQVKKEIIQASEKKSMELKIAPISSKSRICKNKTLMKKKSYKKRLTIASPVDKEPICQNRRTTSKNKMVVEKKPRKRPTSGIDTESQRSLEMTCRGFRKELLQQYSPLLKYRMEPKDPFDENSLEHSNIKEKSTNKTEIVKRKAQKRPVSDITSNDFGNDYTKVENKYKMHLRGQVKKQLMEPSIKKSMEPKIAPKSSKKTVFKNKTRLGKKNSKSCQTSVDETSTCRNKMEPKRVSKVQVKIEPIELPCNIQLEDTEKQLPKKPICRNRDEIETQTRNKPLLETLLDIKKEPVSDIKETANESSSKRETGIKKKTTEKVKVEHSEEISQQQFSKKFTRTTSKKKMVVKRKCRILSEVKAKMGPNEPEESLENTESPERLTSKNKTSVIETPRKRPISGTKKSTTSAKIERKMSKQENNNFKELSPIGRIDEINRLKTLLKMNEKYDPDLKLASDLATDLAASIKRLMWEKFKPVKHDNHTPGCKCKDLHVKSELNGYVSNIASTAREKPVFDFDPANTIVGFLGIGEENKLVIKRLLGCGYSVMSWNQTMNDKILLEMGLKVAKNPAEVISLCNITFCCVADPDTSKKVVFFKNGVLDGFREARYNRKGYVRMSFINHPTSQEISEINQDISRACNQEISQAIKGLGGIYLEVNMICPLPSVKRVGTAVIAEGDEFLFDASQKYFRVLAHDSFFIGCKCGCASKVSNVAKNVLTVVDDLYAEAVKAIKDQNLNGRYFFHILSNTYLNKCNYIMQKATVMFGNSSELAKFFDEDCGLPSMDALIENGP